MNVYTFTARAGADAELRHHDGSPVLSLRLAVDTGKGSAMWLNGSMWGPRAETLAPMITKGTKLIISGALSQREFTARDGSKGTSLEVRINELDFAGPRQDAASEEPAPASRFQAHPSVLEDAIPF